MAPHFNKHKNHIQNLIQAALTAVEPEKTVGSHLALGNKGLRIGKRDFDLDQGRIFVVATGKASIPMGRAAYRILDDNIYRGILISKGLDTEAEDSAKWFGRKPRNLEIIEASHPVPDQKSISATASVLEMLEETVSGDLVLCLISGGTSALLTQPRISLAAWEQLTRILLASGCSIKELNSVRRQLESVKGGGLIKHTEPARCASLILSDVVGNALEDIGSGPTVPGQGEAGTAQAILDRYHVRRKVDVTVWEQLQQILVTDDEEDRENYSEVYNLIVGDVRLAAEAAAAAAKRLGFESQLLTCHLEGEAREVGKVAAALAKDAPPNSCLVLGGETTVTVRGSGRGGRNQELALSAAIALDGWENIVVASVATDGEDGPTEAAGAFATGQTLSSVGVIGLDANDYLADNDSYSFFKRAGTFINLGSTGTNVNDLILIIRYGD